MWLSESQNQTQYLKFQSLYVTKQTSDTTEITHNYKTILDKSGFSRSMALPKVVPDITVPALV